jgi:hypothetical protein
MDCEESSRMAYYLPGLEGAEVIRLESGSIRSIERYQVRESDRETKVNSSALGRT